jgi:hypothetical protein
MEQSFMPLLDQSKAIIFGSLLGDGSLRIQKGYANARLEFRHSIQQKDYLHWKVAMLKDIAGEKSVALQPPDGYSKTEKIRFISRALPSLTELYRLTHRRGRLSIRRTWLNQMTPLSLAIWWLDDGSLISNGRKGVLCTDGFDLSSVKILARYIQIVWGVRTHIAPIYRYRQKVLKTYYRIWIRSTEELKKFLRIILPNIKVVSMIPKVLILYTDPQFQQRWISEIVQATGFSQDIIEHALAEKKMRWRRYRE